MLPRSHATLKALPQYRGLWTNDFGARTRSRSALQSLTFGHFQLGFAMRKPDHLLQHPAS
jgi:hypothetical protein